MTLDFFQNASAAIEHEVGDEFESFRAAVVGVGDFVVVVLAAKVSELADALFIGLVARLAKDVMVIFVVHGDDEIEVVEVVDIKLSCAARDWDTTIFQGRGHAAVWFVADVVAVCAS